MLQIGINSKTHLSHFRTDADNRTEAEQKTPVLEQFPGRSKKEKTIAWEAAVQRKLDGWRYGMVEVSEETSKEQKVRKRRLEDEENTLPKKRARLEGENANMNRAQAIIVDTLDKVQSTPATFQTLS